MNKTKIDWCDSTWNPVTGCLNDCEYCYAREIANRFGGRYYQNADCGYRAYRTKEKSERTIIADDDVQYLYKLECGGEISIVQKPRFVLDEPLKNKNKKGQITIAPYPFTFCPTLYKYRLDDYKNKKSRTIFVGSMADLFGDWIPDDWIEEVFKACVTAPQHRYLFLTKNSARLETLQYNNMLLVGDNYWYGTTVVGGDGYAPVYTSSSKHNTFVSVEPLQGEISKYSLLCSAIRGKGINWVIIGAETGNRKNKIIPKREWIENIVQQCHAENVPVFMKSSLADIWGESLIQEYPWEV
jgi:protein gp37